MKIKVTTRNGTLVGEWDLSEYTNSRGEIDDGLLDDIEEKIDADGYHFTHDSWMDDDGDPA